MKKIVKFLIPVIAIVYAGCKETTQDEKVSTIENLYFFEPGLYKNHLDRELKALYVAYNIEQPRCESGKEMVKASSYSHNSGEGAVSDEKSLNNSDGEENTTDEEENTAKDCVSPLDPDCDNKKWMEVASIDSTGLRLPPKPGPCPQGNCLPWAILLQDVCLSCEVIIFDPDTGEELGRSVDKLIKIPVKGYVAKKLSIDKAIDGNFMMQISRVSARGMESTYTIEMNIRELSSMGY